MINPDETDDHEPGPLRLTILLRGVAVARSVPVINSLGARHGLILR